MNHLYLQVLKFTQLATILWFTALLSCLSLTVATARAADEGRLQNEANNAVSIPRFINPATVTTSGGVVSVRTIRFLTTNDFPPFNFIDPQGRLGGFHIELARALCLEIKARCTMQALAWDDLEGAITHGQGDAIIAGLAISDDTIRRYVFTQPYLRLPARFFATTAFVAANPALTHPVTHKVGVIKGSAHEAFLRAHFAQTPVQTYPDPPALHAALQAGEITFGFADGVSTAFWFQSSDARQCCAFVGGPYLSTDYFGAGLTIAVPLDREDLKQVLDDALGRLARKDKFTEIYLRYFPISFF